MKFIALFAWMSLFASCGGTGTDPSSSSGTLVVYIFWGDQGLSDKKVELLELHQTSATDKAGLAEFIAPAGDYTLRAYDINRGGPALQFVDIPVTITSGHEVRVKVADCLPCV
jgi:hypothetical protein